MREGDECVVEGHDIRMTSSELGVHTCHRTEQHECLIDQMCGDVVHDVLGARARIGSAPAGLWRRSPAVEAGFEPEDVAKRAVADQSLQSEEVPVPPTILKWHGKLPDARRECAELACLRRGSGERLVHHYVLPRFECRVRE